VNKKAAKMAARYATDAAGIRHRLW